MELKEFLQVEEKEEWNKFVAANLFGNVLQSWEWGEVKKTRTWDVLRLGILHKNKLVCVAQILKRKLPFHFCLFYSPYGPVIDWEMPYAEECLNLIKKYLLDQADNRFLFWKIEPPLAISQAQGFKVSEILSRIGFIKVKTAIQPQHTLIVDLKKTEEELLMSFEKDTRYSIRKAEKEEVEIKEVVNPLNLQPIKEFYQLYHVTTQRGRFPARSYKQFTRIWEEMAPSHARCYQAWYKSQLLASSIVLTIGKRAYLVYAGSLREKQHRNRFPSYLLQWETMKRLKTDGFESYDLWGVIPKEQSEHPWAGISLFKRGFKGQELDYLGAYDLPLSRFYPFYITLNQLRYRLNPRHQ